MKISENRRKKIPINTERSFMHPLPVQITRTLFRIVQPGQQFKKSRFSASVSADDKDNFSPIDFERKRLKNKRSSSLRRILKTEILTPERFEFFRLNLGRRSKCLRFTLFRIHLFLKLMDALDRSSRLRQSRNRHDHIPDRSGSKQNHCNHRNNNCEISRIQIRQQKENSSDSEKKKGLPDQNRTVHRSSSLDPQSGRRSDKIVKFIAKKIITFLAIQFEFLKPVEQTVEIVEVFPFAFRRFAHLLIYPLAFCQIEINRTANAGSGNQKGCRRKNSDINNHKSEHHDS